MRGLEQEDRHLFPRHGRVDAEEARPAACSDSSPEDFLDVAVKDVLLRDVQEVGHPAGGQGGAGLADTRGLGHRDVVERARRQGRRRGRELQGIHDDDVLGGNTPDRERHAGQEAGAGDRHAACRRKRRRIRARCSRRRGEEARPSRCGRRRTPRLRSCPSRRSRARAKGEARPKSWRCPGRRCGPSSSRSESRPRRSPTRRTRSWKRGGSRCPTRDSRCTSPGSSWIRRRRWRR